MSNDCCGNLRVVAKKKKTLDRIVKILNCEDSEFGIYRCKDAQDSESYKDGKFWVKDIFVDGAWNCEQFFKYGNRPNSKFVIKTENGKEICGHYTDLCHIAKTLDCGFELYSTEPGMGFCEHLACNRFGKMIDESSDYEYFDDGHEEFGDMDYFGEYMFSDEIYGKENA